MSENALRVIGYLVTSRIAWSDMENVMPYVITEKAADEANEYIFFMTLDCL